MFDKRKDDMQQRLRDGLRLAFTDNAGAGTPLMLLHGWGCDHTTLKHQDEYFRKTHRVVNVDLRGHGRSSSPHENYEVFHFADDVAWLCRELAIRDVVLIGHSMGGAVAIEAAYRHPALVRAVAMVDTVFQPSHALLELLAPLLPDLQGNSYKEAYRRIMLALSRPSEHAALSSVLSTLPSAPQHVLLSALAGHMESHDFSRAAASCKTSVAYIAASGELANLEHLKRILPNLIHGQALGVGHFAPYLAPEQVNAMLSSFLDMVDASESSADPSRF
jgi:pimeloyl-ACP methyl ester carboxylesterase